MQTVQCCTAPVTAQLSQSWPCAASDNNTVGSQRTQQTSEACLKALIEHALQNSQGCCRDAGGHRFAGACTVHRWCRRCHALQRSMYEGLYLQKATASDR